MAACWNWNKVGDTTDSVTTMTVQLETGPATPLWPKGGSFAQKTASLIYLEFQLFFSSKLDFPILFSEYNWEDLVL